MWRRGTDVGSSRVSLYAVQTPVRRLEGGHSHGGSEAGAGAGDTHTHSSALSTALGPVPVPTSLSSPALGSPTRAALDVPSPGLKGRSVLGAGCWALLPPAGLRLWSIQPVCLAGPAWNHHSDWTFEEGWSVHHSAGGQTSHQCQVGAGEGCSHLCRVRPLIVRVRQSNRANRGERGRESS